MLTIAGQTFTSRLLLGTALYASIEDMQRSVKASGAQIITVSLKRQAPTSGVSNVFWDAIKTLNCQLLPNTAGCRTVDQAVTLAKMSRELFETNWVKLELIGDDYTLQPNPFALVKAAEALLAEGFVVLPYCTEDLVLCQHLYALGCDVLMPWGAPIGSGQGLLNCYGLGVLRARLPKATLIVDAGIGAPSHAGLAMEMGMDAVLLNTAVAKAEHAPNMARAFKLAVESGHIAYKSGLMPKRNMASASTALIDTPFWHQVIEED